MVGAPRKDFPQARPSRHGQGVEVRRPRLAAAQAWDELVEAGDVKRQGSCAFKHLNASYDALHHAVRTHKSMAQCTHRHVQMKLRGM